MTRGLLLFKIFIFNDLKRAMSLASPVVASDRRILHSPIVRILDVCSGYRVVGFKPHYESWAGRRGCCGHVLQAIWPVRMA